ncbi:MAG: AmmeMemoRadiSam system protein B, partial [Rhodospirillaceae bacterium]|nr:AmmeMemoRadiSam system protein B [Rhodospirillaceae bacterium]
LGDNFELVPMVVGDASADEIKEILEMLWGGEETLVVISSDLSHYLNYQGAKKVDNETCKAIESMNGDAIGDYQACGRIPLKGLLKIAAEKGLAPTTLDLRNSGDTAGPQDRVVGYGAWAFNKKGQP